MFRVKRNVPLAPLTTFHIGGNANYFTEVTGALELAEALEFADRERLPVFVMGGGSNLLISDKGFSGLVIRIVDGGLVVRGNIICAGAGMTLQRVVDAACEAGLSGLQNLSGIPGSFGGAIRGNAGAFGVEIGDRIKSVKVFETGSGMLHEYRHEECRFSYRNSVFKEQSRFVVVSAEVELESGDKKVLLREKEDIIAKRESKHSQSAWCAGSFFMNPVVSDEALRKEFERDTNQACKDEKLPAGWLIDHVGLRGKKIGGAQISERHPNYLLNTGTATAEDVIMLASLVKRRVRDELGVQLREEPQMVGF